MRNECGVVWRARDGNGPRTMPYVICISRPRELRPPIETFFETTFSFSGQISGKTYDLIKGLICFVKDEGRVESFAQEKTS